MMSFVHRTKVDLRGVALAIEGDRAAIKFAEQVAGRLGMLSFRIPRESKVLYHVLGSFSSPLLIALLRTAEEVAQAAGIRREQARKIIGPILEQTTRNYRETGAERAFTGPIARGDVKTVAKHLQALKRVPTAEPIYRALASLAAEKLPAAERGGFRKLLRTLASGKEMA
jgi:predicted short-subunit dehydrogenase-like oxidoreductase (DUF2520 family)